MKPQQALESWSRRLALPAVLLAWVCAPACVRAAVYHAGPASYGSVVKHLKAGDTVMLDPGVYREDLILHELNGGPGRPIVIHGITGRQHTIFVARPGHNTISLSNASYIELHDLVLDGRGLNVDAVKAEGPSRFAHHITLDGLVIFGYDADQQNVGISTKSPAWAWTVRNCIIDTAGTGMYFGQSDGSAPFFDALIEHNVVLDTTGYNIEIKHQNRWPPLPVDGPRAGTTIIRYNVFSKTRNGSRGPLARPNVLVDHWPDTGMGSGDFYQVYGNFFYENPTERLFQGEGNIALYDNLLVNDFGDAVSIQRHHGPAKHIEIFDNTVVARGAGILVHGADPRYRQRVFANAVFAAVPLSGGSREANVTAAYDRAPAYLNRPAGTVVDEAAAVVAAARREVARLERGDAARNAGDHGRARVGPAASAGAEPRQQADNLDLYPRPGRLRLAAAPPAPALARADTDRDFNGLRRRGRFSGAYAGEGANPGWLPALGPIPPRQPGH